MHCLVKISQTDILPLRVAKLARVQRVAKLTKDGNIFCEIVK